MNLSGYLLTYEVEENGLLSLLSSPDLVLRLSFSFPSLLTFSYFLYSSYSLACTSFTVLCLFLLFSSPFVSVSVHRHTRLSSLPQTSVFTQGGKLIILLMTKVKKLKAANEQRLQKIDKIETINA